ncbi:MAG: hypothetical protein ACKOSQ_11755 [Planctomycetaceae bacterium]
MADLVFAFDPALDRPLPVPESASPAVAETIGGAVPAAFAAAVATAASGRAAALVLLGRVLDPLRASPAQAAALRRHVTALADAGCRTVVVADGTAACHDLARMLGEPAGLCFVTPLAGCEFDVRGIAVEIVSAHGPLAATAPVVSAGLRRRIVVGCDAEPVPVRGRSDAAADARIADPFAFAVDAAPAWAHPGSFWVWGSRRRRPLPPGVHALAALQAGDPLEAGPGCCAALAVLDRATTDAGPSGPLSDWRGSWREIPTHRVAWRTLSIESPAGGDEELATAIWSALGSRPEQPTAALEVVRVAVACGTSVARRVRVAEIAAETLARLRQLHDPQASRIWVRDLVADPHESLAPLGHERSGGRPGTTTSFSSALADIVARLETAAGPHREADPAREAGWLALELVEAI